MGSSFIGYNEKGFWVADSFICPLIGMISEYIIRTRKEQWLLEYAVDLKDYAKGYFNGSTSLLLDYYIDSDEKRNKIITIFKEFKEEIKGKESISPTELNMHLDVESIGYEIENPLDSYYYIRALKRIIEALNGLGTKSGDGDASIFR